MKQTAKTGGKRIACGAAVSMAVYLALLALLAQLIVRGTVEESGMSWLVWVFACIAVFAGAKTAALKTGGRPTETVGCAAAFWAAALLAGFLTNDALEPASALELALASCAGGTLAYLTGRGGSKKGKRKRRSHK